MIQFTYSGPIEDLEKLLGGAGIKQELETIMATTAELAAAFGDLKSALMAEVEQINQKLTELGNAGTEAERAALLADIQGTTETIKGIIEDAPAPEEEEPTPGE